MSSRIILLLFAVALLNTQSWLPSSQVESTAFRNEVSNNANASTSMEQQQNIVVEGDIVVESGTYLIENTCFNLTGKITASNDATIMIRNATLLLTTREQTILRDGIVLADRSKLVVENATIVLGSPNELEQSYVTVGDEAMANITDSELYGHAYIRGRQNSRIYINRSILNGYDPFYFPHDVSFSVITQDNSTARIQDSKLDDTYAKGSSSVYISNSIIQERLSVGENCSIEIEDSLLRRVVSGGSGPETYSISVRDSTIVSFLEVFGNSTVWLTNVSAKEVTACGNCTVWLINSYAEMISTYDQGNVYIGWQLPLFGIIAFPHNWLPILQGIAFLAASVLTIALLVVLKRRWKKWQLQKLKQ